MAASKSIINSILLLRIFTLMLLAASIALTLTIEFSDIKSFRYVLAVGAAGALYTLIQLPFAIYHAVKEKRMIRGKFLPNFDFYGDKVISFLLASGVGVGLSVSFEYKNIIDPLSNALQFLGADGVEDFRPESKKFFDREILASGILLGGFVTMAILSILTSLNKSGKSFFG